MKNHFLNFSRNFPFSFQDWEHPNYVNYVEFCLSLNKAIKAGKEVVKNPQINPQKLFENVEEDRESFLNFAERVKLSEILQKLVKSSHVASLKDIFKDYSGRCNIITRYSLEKVMKNYNLSSDDLDLIFKCFSLPVALKKRKFNFKNFVETLKVMM